MWQRLEKVLVTVTVYVYAAFKRICLFVLRCYRSLHIFKAREIVLCIASLRSWLTVTSNIHSSHLLRGKSGRVVGLLCDVDKQVFVYMQDAATFFVSLSYLQRCMFFIWKMRGGSRLSVRVLCMPSDILVIDQIMRQANTLPKLPQLQVPNLQVDVCLIALSDLYGYSKKHANISLPVTILQERGFWQAHIYNLFLQCLSRPDVSYSQSVFFVVGMHNIFMQLAMIFSTQSSARKNIQFFCCAERCWPLVTSCASTRFKHGRSLWKKYFSVIICLLCFIYALFSMLAAYNTFTSVRLLRAQHSLASDIKYYKQLSAHNNFFVLPTLKSFYNRMQYAVQDDALSIVDSRANNSRVYLQDMLAEHTSKHADLLTDRSVQTYLYLYFLQNLKHNNQFLFNVATGLRPLSLNIAPLLVAMPQQQRSDIAALLMRFRSSLQLVSPSTLLSVLADVFVRQYIMLPANERVVFYKQLLLCAHGQEFWDAFAVYDAAQRNKFLSVFKVRLSARLHKKIAARPLAIKFSQSFLNSFTPASVWGQEIASLFYTADIKPDANKLAIYYSSLHEIAMLLSQPLPRQTALIDNYLNGQGASLFLQASNYARELLPSAAPLYLRQDLYYPLRVLWLHFARLYVAKLNVAWRNFLSTHDNLVLCPAQNCANKKAYLNMLQNFSNASPLGKWIIKNINPLLRFANNKISIKQYLNQPLPLSKLFVKRVYVWRSFLSNIADNKSVLWRGHWRALASSRVALWSMNISGVELSYANGLSVWRSLLIKPKPQQFIDIHVLTISGKQYDLHKQGDDFFILQFLAQNISYSYKLHCLLLRLSSKPDAPLIALRTGHDLNWLQLLQSGFSFPKNINIY